MATNNSTTPLATVTSTALSAVNTSLGFDDSASNGTIIPPDTSEIGEGSYILVSETTDTLALD